MLARQKLDLEGCVMSDEPEEITIETPDGEVTTKRTTVDEVAQAVAVVEGEDLQWLEELAEHGPAFVKTYLPLVIEPELKDYDAAFHAWQNDPSRLYTDDDVIHIVGGYLGNKLITDFDMQWVTVTDEYGTDYAVQGKQLEVMCFAFSTVAKRIENNEHDFVYGVYYALKNVMEEGESAYRKPGE